jgi:hypothetical protein
MNILSSQIREIIRIVEESGVIQKEGIVQLKKVFVEAFNWHSIPTDSDNIKMIMNTEYGASSIYISIKSPIEPETKIDFSMSLSEIKNGAVWIKLTPKAAYRIRINEDPHSMKMHLSYCLE